MKAHSITKNEARMLMKIASGTKAHRDLSGCRAQSLTLVSLRKKAMIERESTGPGPDAFSYWLTPTGQGMAAILEAFKEVPR